MFTKPISVPSKQEFIRMAAGAWLRVVEIIPSAMLSREFLEDLV